MNQRRLFELLTSKDGASGDLGFKLTGRAPEGDGLCRVWLRRCEPWERYLDPRVRSETWDVRAYEYFDSAFALIPEFTLADLPDLGQRYTFPEKPKGLATLTKNDDPVHDGVLEWACEVTGTELGSRPAPAEEPPAEPAEAAAEEEPSGGEDEAASDESHAEEPAGESAEGAVSETPEDANPAAEAADSSDDGQAEGVDSGWDDAMEVAIRASGSHPAVEDTDDKSADS